MHSSLDECSMWTRQLNGDNLGLNPQLVYYFCQIRQFYSSWFKSPVSVHTTKAIQDYAIWTTEQRGCWFNSPAECQLLEWYWLTGTRENYFVKCFLLLTMLCFCRWTTWSWAIWTAKFYQFHTQLEPSPGQYALDILRGQFDLHNSNWWQSTVAHSPYAGPKLKPLVAAAVAAAHSIQLGRLVAWHPNQTLAEVLLSHFR